MERIVNNIGSWASIIALIIVIVGWDFLTNLVKNYPRESLVVIFVLVISVMIIVGMFFQKRRDHKKTHPKYDKPTKWKHSVLIIDNDEHFLSGLEDYLLGNLDQDRVDLVCISRIPDYRLADSFEIIISDIVGAGYGTREAISSMKAIKNAHPYKIVATMSEAKPSSTDGVFSVFFAKKKKSFNNDIKEFIEKSFDNLEQVNTYWGEIETKLKKNHMTQKEIDVIRDDYYHFIEKTLSKSYYS